MKVFKNTKLLQFEVGLCFFPIHNTRRNAPKYVSSLAKHLIQKNVTKLVGSKLSSSCRISLFLARAQLDGITVAVTYK